MKIAKKYTVQEIVDLFRRLDPEADRGEVEKSIERFMAAGFDLTTTKLSDGTFNHTFTLNSDPRAAHATDEREAKPL